MIRSNRRTAEENRWLKVLSTLNEYQARLYVADRALDHGRGGISRLSQLTGMSRTTITEAVAELNRRGKLAVAGEGRIRETGGGRAQTRTPGGGGDLTGGENRGGAGKGRTGERGGGRKKGEEPAPGLQAAL